MNKEIIKTIIADFHKRGLPDFIQRETKIPLDTGKIITLVGARRAGKTYSMYQLMSEIKDITDIIYINFEDERLQLDLENLNTIIEAYFELYPKKTEKQVYFFFDEIQEMKGWEKFVRRIYDTVSKKIFLTGSSAKMLHKEIATSLRGRTINFEILPLSFYEFLKFKKTSLDIISTKGKAYISGLFKSYLQKSSFPETINMPDFIIEKTLRTYFDVMLYRDIIDRYQISNVIALKYLMKKLLMNTAKEFSIHKIYNELKSRGIRISKDTLYKLVNYFEDAYIIFQVQNFSQSINNQTQKKAYTIDQGLSTILSFTLSEDVGRLLESIVYLELKRRYSEIFYYKDKGECDFILKEKSKITQAYQVCAYITDDNKNREFTGLTKAMEKFHLKRGVIITLNQKKTEGKIEIIPAYEWMLTKHI